MTEPYPPQQPYAAAPQGPNNTTGLLAMIFGIAAIPLVCCCYIGVPLGGAGIVMGILGKQKADRGEATNRSQAVIGLWTGVGAIAFAVILVILNMLFKMGSFNLNSYINR